MEAADRLNGLGGQDPGSTEFRDVLARAGLQEMGTSDCLFTWRGSTNPMARSRLDRFLCSVEMLEAFPSALVTALPRPISDHTPIMWTTQGENDRPPYFKMDRSWFQEEGFAEDIATWWEAQPARGFASARLVTKLRGLRHHLIGWRRRIREDRTRIRDGALRAIQEMDTLEDTRPLSAEEHAARKEFRNAVAEADLKIEMDWRQRSRQLWLAVGDANTRFFHQAASGRRRLNRIHSIRVGDRSYNGHAAVGTAIANHFRAFYRKGPRNKWEWTGEGAARLSAGQQGQLTRPFTEEEVRAAIRGLNGEGAPGPDGIPVFFYQECWDLVGPEVMATIEDFCIGVCNMDHMNKAFLVLIPKCQGAEQVGDFRPISLSNSIYLIIAKVLANRLREVINYLVGAAQTVFIPGRQMVDSVVMAEEIVAAWRRRGTKGFMWKLDFAKAYDSLDWRFIWRVLQRRGFTATWVRWMKQCVCTNTFAVLVNGRPQGGWIHPQRGIRQGCPLAPLLFILAADTLAVCTERLCMGGLLAGFQTAGWPGGVPLLQYADDTIFFIEGSVAATEKVSALLDLFSDFSGLSLNRAKSTFIGFGMSAEERDRCARILDTPTGSLPIRYLGLPLVEGRITTREWQPVLEAMERRLGGWRARLLSRGGRLVLLKSVLSAIPTYFMSVFSLPVGICKRMEAIMRRFFWHRAETNGTRGRALVKWSTVCRPTTEGGLGVRNLRHTNTALLMKWVRKMMQAPSDMVTRTIMDSYGTLLDWGQRSEQRRGESAFYKGLRPVFAQAQSLFQAKLGDRVNFRFWLYDWSEFGLLRDVFPRLYGLSTNPEATVQQAWCNTWCPPLPDAMLEQRIEDLLRMQTTLAHLRPAKAGRDAWE